MAELETGRIIGSYRVVRCIGKGGMGTVYEVEHVELGVHYALKTFTFDPTNDASHALKTKFLEEGKVLARLKHPNIAHVFDLAFDEETQMPYFVMDLVTYEDGESYTAEDVDPNDIDEEVVYGWFKELASALDYIHEQGIVHRDIKPGNLLMDKDAHVILTDFGISRIFGERLKTDVDATKTMVSKTGRGKLVLGTESYIAPEVERGGEAVPESDAYSLGVMVLRWLTGFFYKDNPGALGLLSKTKYHWLPVIARLLAPTPDRRPKTYSDLVKQLKPIAGGMAESISPTQEPVEQKRKKKRDKTRENIIAAAIGLFVAGLLAVTGWFGYQGWCKYEADKRANAAQLAAIKQQMRDKEAAEAKAKAEAEAAAQKKAAEEKRIADEKAKRETERKAALAKQRQDEERLRQQHAPVSTVDIAAAIAKNFLLSVAVYGAFENELPIKDKSVDFTEKLNELLLQGKSKIMISNVLAGRDPAPGTSKRALIKYSWRGVAGSVVLKEDEYLEITAAGVVKPRGERFERKFEIENEVVGSNVDLGEIPKVQYPWFNNGDKTSPSEQVFKLANGCTIKLIPFAPTTFQMLNPKNAPKRCHQVTLTKSFWMSQHYVSARQLSEFAPSDYKWAEEFWKAVPPEHPFCVTMPQKSIDAYCKYLTNKYRSQLPKGYIFRLPTEAERDLALSFEETCNKYGRFDVGNHYSMHPGGTIAKENFAKLRSKIKKLDGLAKWSDAGFKLGAPYSRIAGLSVPSAKGIYNLFEDWPSPCLDTFSREECKEGGFDAVRVLNYADEETDPLHWCESEEPYTDTWRCLRRRFEYDRCYYIRDEAYFHIVLGPDVVAETAWTNEKKRYAVATKLPNVKYNWKTHGKISKERRIDFKMASGATMPFCEIPSGKFVMSNVERQDKRTHDVKLTNPFWISKYLVTAAQLREYAPFDTDLATRKIENAFAKNPIGVRASHYVWDAFCDFLTERYRVQLPKGYVFRLPTEAEWEYVLAGDARNGVGDLRGDLYDFGNDKHIAEFQKLIAKRKDLKWCFGSAWGYARGCGNAFIIGGRTMPNCWGVCDMWPSDAGQWTLDNVDVWGEAHPEKDIKYEDHECDPIRWSTVGQYKAIARFGLRCRHCQNSTDRFAAHIVIGPDVLKDLRAAEGRPYPLEDFGGRMISEKAVVSGVSSEQFKTKADVLLSRAPIEGLCLDDSRAFQTQSADAPWIQIELPAKAIITGIVIEDPSCPDHQVPLEICLSADGKNEKRVFVDDTARLRYRIDLTRNREKYKFVRILRTPSAKKNMWFNLHKILIYGKEK